MQEREGLRKMTKVKIIVILVVSLLSLIVFIQNRQAVDTKLLSVTVTMPLVLLLILTFIMGSILGLVIASYVLRKPRKPEKQ
ncbi:MAG: LapA family protein [Phycisphaerales bacterium]